MTNPLQWQIWHRSIGNLIEKLNRPEFWDSLVRVISEYIPVDNWVVLMFDSTGVSIVCFPEMAEDAELDGLTNQYSKGLYQLDPFYIANKEKKQDGLFHLLDISPTHFKQTEYYESYFKKFVVEDEVQYNVQLDADRTLSFSMGSSSRFTQGNIAVLDLIKPWVLSLMKQRMIFESNAERDTTSKNWQDSILHLAPQLTQREVEVLKLTLTGFSNNEIAGKLQLSPETIKVHRKNFYQKLNVRSQTELFSRFFQSTL
ncbi:response regulator transcription factor [Pseudomonas fragariae (ex Marin et al. 2024)]|uniref:helix-turn-helix transcriptional regulator n=1 Tax=Pseudomonas fragariae (ex Marin et al. 2024) TaxID=3080056 RepID=UPI003F79F032